MLEPSKGSGGTLTAPKAPKVEIVTINGKKFRKRTHYEVVNTTTERVETKTFDIPINENSTNESITEQLKGMMKREEEAEKCTSIVAAPLQVPIIIPKNKNHNILRHHKEAILNSKDVKQVTHTSTTGASASFKQKVKMMLMKDPNANTGAQDAKQRSLSVGARPLSCDGAYSEDMDDEDERITDTSAINAADDMCAGMVKENARAAALSDASQATFSDIHQLKALLKPMNKQRSTSSIPIADTCASIVQSHARLKVSAQDVAREISASLQQESNEVITQNFKQQHQVFIAPPSTTATEGSERHSLNSFSMTKSIIKNSEDDITMKKTEKSVSLSFSIAGLNIKGDAAGEEMKECFAPSRPLVLKASPANSFSLKKRSFREEQESNLEETEDEAGGPKEITDASVKEAIKLIDVFLAASTTANRVEGSMRRPPLPKTAIKKPSVRSITEKDEPTKRSISIEKKKS